MDGTVAGVITAAWLGILTSISPCPLATNVAAMSFIGQNLVSPKKVLLTGIVYTAGRMAAYAAVAGLLIASVFAIPDVAFLLETYMNKLLGPILILTGILLLEILPIRFSASCVTAPLQTRLSNSGVLGAGLLGMFFALSFCPVSAALFFGSLIPLAMSHSSSVVLPSVYGIGTGLPVFIFAVLVALGAHRVGKTFNSLVRFEKWARRITAGVFILVGIRHCLNYIFEVQFL